MKPVLVTWRDASTESHMNWEPRDAKPIEDTLVLTVGFIRPESDSSPNLELVMSYHEYEFAGRWSIPRCCILEIKELT